MHETTDTLALVNDPEGCWLAHCPQCGHSFDISEIGYRRVNAVSYGLRRSMRCPHCSKTSGMSIVHVDRHGVPDQPFIYVLRKVLLLQAKIFGTILLVAAGVGVLIAFVKSQ